MKIVVYGPERRTGALRDNSVVDLSYAFAKYAHEKGLTLREAGTELGLVDEETFDRVVKPENMLGR